MKYSDSVETNRNTILKYPVPVKRKRIWIINIPIPIRFLITPIRLIPNVSNISGATDQIFKGRFVGSTTTISITTITSTTSYLLLTQF